MNNSLQLLESIDYITLLWGDVEIDYPAKLYYIILDYDPMITLRI